MTIISTIRPGYRIQTTDDVYTVGHALKVRSGYKYVCTNKSGRRVSLDRNDVLEAQRDGSAVVLGA